MKQQQFHSWNMTLGLFPASQLDWDRRGTALALGCMDDDGMMGNDHI